MGTSPDAPAMRLALLLGVVAMSGAAVAGAAPLGDLNEFSANPGSVPFRIVSGGDGNLWFSDQGAPKAIGRITTGGTIISGYALTSTSVPRHVRVVGADGNTW